MEVKKVDLEPPKMFKFTIKEQKRDVFHDKLLVETTIYVDITEKEFIENKFLQKMIKNPHKCTYIHFQEALDYGFANRHLNTSWLLTGFDNCTIDHKLNSEICMRSIIKDIAYDRKADDIRLYFKLFYMEENTMPTWGTNYVGGKVDKVTYAAMDSAVTAAIYSTKKEDTPNEKQKKHINDAKRALHLLGITKVIFNNNATIVFFDDGGKEVVKCTQYDFWSKESGIALAYFKHKTKAENFHYCLKALTGEKGCEVETHYGRKIKIIDMDETGVG